MKAFQAVVNKPWAITPEYLPTILQIAARENPASAACWIASAADEVVVADTAMVGSIGVIAAIAKKDADSVDSVEFVSSVSPNTRPDPESKSGAAQIQTMIDDIATVVKGPDVQLETRDSRDS